MHLLHRGITLFSICVVCLCGCAINPHQNCCDPEASTNLEKSAKLAKNDKLIKTYQLSEDNGVKWERPIFCFPASHNSSDAPPLLLLHEYPYLSPNTFELAKKLADNGFTVYVPTLYGEPLKYDLWGNSWFLFTSPDWFVTFSEHKTSPIIRRLRELADEINKAHGGRGIGVIGQCLTGTFPLALASDPCVKAVVCAQPATPLIALTDEAKKSFGLSPEDIRDALKSAVPIFSIRFQGDMVSPPERLSALKEQFPSALPIWIINTPATESEALWTKYGIAPHAHPTLTYCLPEKMRNKTDNPINLAFVGMVTFLHKHL